MQGTATVGGHGHWRSRLSRTEVPPGKHFIAIKVLDRALKGGIWKSVKIARPTA